MSWNRVLWGVEFSSKIDGPIVIGAAWDNIFPNAYVGEPTRALLFNTRRQAREWCHRRNEANNQPGWKFKPIKIRETLENLK
jgi:hypothetical protein